MLGLENQVWRSSVLGQILRHQDVETCVTCANVERKLLLQTTFHILYHSNFKDRWCQDIVSLFEI